MKTGQSAASRKKVVAKNGGAEELGYTFQLPTNYKVKSKVSEEDEGEPLLEKVKRYLPKRWPKMGVYWAQPRIGFPTAIGLEFTPYAHPVGFDFSVNLGVVEFLLSL